MLKTCLSALLLICTALSPAQASPVKPILINITATGANGDGHTLNTIAIQHAIDSCTALGGGIVQVPAGKFLTGTILLKSNVTLQLDENATLLGSTDIKDYQVIDGFKDGLGQQMGYALIGAVDIQHTGITGKGTIDGQGKLVYASGGHQRRPFLVRFVRCDTVNITGVRLTAPTAWTLHFFHCKNIQASNLTIYSRGLGNNDGIDIDCCEQVVIRDCDINSGDDAICFKTTSPYPCRKVSVSNIRINTGEGAIKFGTESAGNFEDITVKNINVAFAREGGIKIFSVDGSHINNIAISDVEMDSVNMPVIMRLGARLKTFRDGDAKQPPGSITNISIKNVNVKHGTWTGMLISGIPGHLIENVSLENIHINIPGTGTAADAAVVLEEKPADYPEIKMFGKIIPAYGLYIRHVSNFRFNNITFTSDKTDERPAIIGYDLANINFSKWKFPASGGNGPVAIISDANKVQMKNITLPKNPKTFLQLGGASSGGIVVPKNLTVTTDSSVPENAVTKQ
ncbi:glycoside hydrolase family 28 protein [Chitinophaga sp. Cy-1792]|uniref:glycoside hydrolase family 28 protein n=1 Tax=Chitinophaga sp. Cy-1792 TaxID=2608339 RepID=UPI00141DC5B6|nr:glycosyl hydrolase family 28 protein [Chitinophaga sp. Cy-1792]NIG53076.1 glycoside hydrolase family 28 protein [Chitinophaga sp. Cy-1792]